MQEVEITTQLLVQFSTEYSRVPIVDLGGNMQGIPFTHQVLACWVSNLKENKDNSLYSIFTGWLCGHGKFIRPDTTSGEVMTALADSLRPIVRDNDGS